MLNAKQLKRQRYLEGRRARRADAECIDACARLGAWVIRMKAACMMVPGYLEAHANNLDDIRVGAGDSVRAAREQLEELLVSVPSVPTKAGDG